ncbi:MAG: DAK2 domain-containing protein [Clostridiales bacterium]|nr:DAK2 domain-containing protein [Clostridiales bacterium]
MQKTINAILLRKMILSGSKMLEINRVAVDALNVFPVPDGDTGTNMSLTIQSAVKEVNACKTNNMSDIADAVARGALRGARGNSGVILSQIFRGLFQVMKEMDQVETKDFAKAMKVATEIAYGAVSKPKEGTILTVARLMSEFATANASKMKDFEVFLPAVIQAGEDALATTPELLPVLKKAGVVDAGGKGLLFVYKGMLKAMMGEEVEGSAQQEEEADAVEMATDAELADYASLDEIEFGYCTEFFIINLYKKTTLADIDKLREKLMAIGDSVIVIGDLEMVKVHVHTNTPGVALSHALELGELDRLKIENMLEQYRQLLAKVEAEKKEQGMLAISAGAGLSDIFKSLNVDRVIEGGQTMNPSADDIASAVQRVNAEHVFVFPNNKNIILAAEQAKALVDNRRIHVVPTKNIPQGFAAALAFDPDADVEENVFNLLHAIDNVTAGQVTTAVRDANIDGHELKTGDIIGLDNKKILTKGDSVAEVTLALIEKLRTDDHEIITLYSGQDVDQADAEALLDKVAEAYPDMEVDLHVGGQPLYYYFISLE